MSGALNALLGCMLLAASLPAQRVQRIELQHPSDEEFRFTPARITAAAGDILEFTVTSGGPYQVGFVAEDLTPEEARQLQVALGETPGGLRGPVLAGKGATFRVRLPPLRAGKYRFLSVTHAAYRMQGEVVVK